MTKDHSTNLCYVSDTSDKTYNVQLIDQPDGFVVNFEFGRTGGSLTKGTKTPTPVAYQEAKTIYDELISEKIANGYGPASKNESVSLFFVSGSSDKTYNVQLEEKPDGFVVNFQYGRTGAALTAGTKTKAPLPYIKAKAAYTKLVADKKAKGYSPDKNGVPFSFTDKADDITGFQPKLLNTITPDDVPALYDAWKNSIALQTKHDGERRGILSNGTTPVGANRKGQSVNLRQDINTALTRLITDMNVHIDTEDMGDHLQIFDVTMINGKSVTNQPFKMRAQHLDTIAAYLAQNNLDTLLKVTQTIWADDLEEVLIFIENARACNEEGVVILDGTAPYTPGRPASGGNIRKLKFVERATVRVKTPHETKRSVLLEIMDGKTWIEIGNVTIPANYTIPTKNEVVEVEYLYAYKGGSLYQPVYKGPRTDLYETAATYDQLKFKGEL
jgi:bifunctional non-homologous end joining protein LigD